jgi:hypothetical protein
VKIISTFVPGLSTFKFGNVDELERLLDLWNDKMYLYEYFEINLDRFSYYDLTSTREAVEATLKQVRGLKDKLIDMALHNRGNLDSLFKNLDNNAYKSGILLPKQKLPQRWLRMYAIKIESNHYVITGGALKPTKYMDEGAETLLELEKLERCRNYLQDQGVYDALTFNELIFDDEI